MSQTPQPKNEDMPSNQPNGLWSFLRYAFSFFEAVLKAVQKDTHLAILWGFGVLFLVVIIVAFVLAKDMPPLAKLSLVMLIVLILAGLFVYTVPRTDPRKVYPKFGDIDSLIARSAAGETSENRKSAINGLAQMKSKSAIEAIENILRYDSDEEVRKEAAGALGRIGDPAAIPILLDILKNERWLVAAASATSLGYLGDKSVIPELERTVKTGDWLMAQNAMQSIVRLGKGDPSLVPFIIKSFDSEHHRWVAEVGVQALATDYKQSAFQPLIQALSSSSREVRFYATKTLGALGDPNALEALKQRLEIEADEFIRKEIERSINLLAD